MRSSASLVPRAVCDVDQVSRCQSDVVPGDGADGVGDRRDVGSAVQKGQDRAVDKWTTALRGRGRQDTVARAKVAHWLGNSALEDDLSVATETTTSFGRDRMF